MLETPEARAELRSNLEAWPQFQPVAAQKMLELLDMVERLEKEAEWLSKRLAEFCDPEHDEPCCYLCRECCDRVKAHEWRDAARKALQESSK